MPSRFCLPDELGHEAWQRFGGLTPPALVPQPTHLVVDNDCAAAAVAPVVFMADGFVWEDRRS